jgi:hypothetical protein
MPRLVVPPSHFPPHVSITPHSVPRRMPPHVSITPHSVPRRMRTPQFDLPIMHSPSSAAPTWCTCPPWRRCARLPGRTVARGVSIAAGRRPANSRRASRSPWPVTCVSMNKQACLVRCDTAHSDGEAAKGEVSALRLVRAPVATHSRSKIALGSSIVTQLQSDCISVCFS